MRDDGSTRPATGLAGALCRERRWAVLALAALAIGAAQAFAVLPLSLILGTGRFWDFPRGTVPGSAADMAQVLVGYLALVQAPWGWPLLQAPTLLPPAGTNIFWLDAVPLVSLAGKLVFSVSGQLVNLLGAYLFACLALPGVAMAGLLWAAGARSLLAAVAGAALADAMPFFLFEWGHTALFAQALIVAALFLYVSGLRRPAAPWLAPAWLILLAGAALTNLYLFAMAGGCWAAMLVQLGLDRRLGGPRWLLQAAATVGLVAALLAATGILSPELGRAGSGGYGVFSLNLGSPFVPQLSGAIPPLRGYWLGMHQQVFGYLGLGGLLVLAAGLVLGRRWIGRGARAHAALLVLFAAWYGFALSHQIRLGSHLLLGIPLPERLVLALGAFRSAGRFFWPIGFAAVAAAVVAVLRHARPGMATVLLLAAAALQMLDAGPIRDGIATTAAAPAAPALDRARAAALLAGATGVGVFPVFDCERIDLDAAGHPTAESARQAQAIMEVQLLAARANLPINSVDNSRGTPDCAAADRAMHAPLRPGQVYFYLLPFRPEGAACTEIAGAGVCGGR